jgi:hypothetical protein
MRLIIVWAIKAAIIKIYFHFNFTVFCCPGSSPNSIIGAKLIALDNVWKADQPALGNRAFTLPRVKKK